MAFPPPSLVDLVALAVVAIGGIVGLIRGLSGELARLISTVVALLLGLRFYRPIGEWAVEHTRLTGRAALAMGFIITILAVVVVTLFIRYATKRVLKIVVEDGAERIGGLVAGVLSASLSVFICFVMLNLMPNPYVNQKFGEDSIVGTAVLASMPTLRKLVDKVDPSPPDHDAERE